MRRRRPWVATEIRVPSAAQKTSRLAITAAGSATGTSEKTSTDTSVATRTQADSHRRWNRAAQTTGIRATMATPDVVPAAMVSARTDPA